MIFGIIVKSIIKFVIIYSKVYNKKEPLRFFFILHISLPCEYLLKIVLIICLTFTL